MKKTELRNENTMNIDKVSTLEAVTLINNEDKKVADAVNKVLPDIAEAVDLVVDSFSKGGRLIYIGAGTSGRLGVLDASECPPTYGVSSEQVVGIIAGGDGCLRNASEGAEDSEENGILDVKAVNISNKDTLVGISVSGNAKYIIGALHYAKSVGAHTVSLTCNEDALINNEADVAIITDTGSEVITGSTRMKAATAHKMVINMLSTVSMIKTGKVISNLMVNVKPVNIKLRDRCARIVNTLTDLSIEEALTKLDNGKSIREIVDECNK